MTQNDTTATGLTFSTALIALGQHMQWNEDLSVRNVSWLFWRRDDHCAPSVAGLDIHCSAGPESLARWAQTLSDVTSLVDRFDDEDGTLFGHVYGRMGDVPVCLWAKLPGDAFPSEPGVHAWDVTVQLQEA